MTHAPETMHIPALLVWPAVAVAMAVTLPAARLLLPRVFPYANF
jgi:hypothetical protein